MVKDDNWIYCGDQTAVYTNIESFCTSETNIMIYDNISIRK